MACLSVLLSRIWGFFVTNAVITGWAITNVNPHSTSLLYAWLVSLCDLVYVVDALSRTSKRVLRSVITVNLALLFNYKSPFFIFEIMFFPLKMLTILPYHVMVVLELDETGVYSVMCLLRLVVLFTSGRFHITFAFSKSRKQESTHAPQENKDSSLQVQTNSWQQRKRGTDNQISVVWKPGLAVQRTII